MLGNQAFGPYGNTQYQSGTLGTAKGFTGQYQDPSGLDYDTARYYDPVVGLFISADSVQSNQQGMNPYAYVGGNPETDTDPTGTFVASRSGQGYYPSVRVPGTNTWTKPVFFTYSANYYTGTFSTTTPVTHSTGNTTQTHSSGPLGFFSGVVNFVKKTATDAVHNPGKTLWHIADTFLGISSMAHDFQVLQSGASWQDKLMALGDLGFNAVSDAMLLTGVGDLADIGIKIGADLLEHGGIETVSHIAEEEGEHVVEDEVEHAAEGCGGLSFSSNTLVTTSVGAKAIGTLKVGQKVWSYNPKTKKMEWEPIQHVWIDHDNDLVDLTIGWTKHTKKGDVHEDETIHTNQKHPFLTVEEGFVPVSSLHVGMHLVEGNGQIAIIEDWLVIAGSQTMYNLTVQQDHTYTVGDGQFVVHNTGCVNVTLSRSNYPETAQHIEDAIANGQPDTLTLDRTMTNANRRAALKNYPKISGFDRDEYPMAMTREGGQGADVRYISPSDNQGAGASIGNQLRSYPNGTQFKIIIVP